ncbi:FliO/MopB family protein [Kiloniella sp.]|uniref:FliO/MopB family protein n=1 Tax=Kiloniella sp. TaxID=1938587 RepID=UPI003A9036A8
MDYGNYFQFFLSLIFIIGLIFAFSIIAKKLGLGHGPAITGNKQKRIQITEVKPLDAKRKIVLIQCDNKEHLVLVGGTNDLLLDTVPRNISLDQIDKTKAPIGAGKMNESSGV